MRSATWEGHRDHLGKVMGRLRNVALNLNVKKCHFGLQEIEMLGNIVSESGVRTDRAKTIDVVSAVVLATKKEPRALRGMVSYYLRFIRAIAGVAAPLHALTSENSPFM